MFLVERNTHLLVASSVKDEPLMKSGKRITPAGSSDAVTQAAAAALNLKYTRIPTAVCEFLK